MQTPPGTGQLGPSGSNTHNAAADPITRHGDRQLPTFVQRNDVLCADAFQQPMYRPNYNGSSGPPSMPFTGYGGAKHGSHRAEDVYQHPSPPDNIPSPYVMRGYDRRVDPHVPLPQYTAETAQRALPIYASPSAHYPERVQQQLHPHTYYQQRPLHHPGFATISGQNPTPASYPTPPYYPQCSPVAPLLGNSYPSSTAFSERNPVAQFAGRQRCMDGGMEFEERELPDGQKRYHCQYVERDGSPCNQEFKRREHLKRHWKKHTVG